MLITSSFLTLPVVIFVFFRITRKKRYSQKDWRITHEAPIQQWLNRLRVDPEEGPPHDAQQFARYTTWLGAVARVRLRPPLTEDPIEDAPSGESDDAVDEYDAMTRGGTQMQHGHLQNYMVKAYYL